MDETRKNNILNILFSVLLFGGLWGVVEATLGSLLHMPFMNALGIFGTSTAVMLPIAYFLMGACYKRSGTFRSVLYMGILAASIKALACAIFHMSFNPVFYMLIEALMMAGALLVIRPKNVISFNGLATVIIANTAYLLASTFIRVNVMNVTASELADNMIHYVLTLNCLAILYTLVAGSAIYGLLKLSEVNNWSFDSIKKIVYSPITASIVAVTAVALTLAIH